ncbi:Holliday junction branch migration protein RuvA [Pseudobdellovibrio sp. HCB154]|uniref:Holliday junction branch migration protein RuvA n=1 Tax=Pseudobdellovibrio sp. HCB154 TaxID=3386277 RepID=UPI003916FC7A
MIGFLEGTVFDVTPDNLILKVNGVGYEVMTTTQTLSDAQVLMGQNLPLWIYSHVREDAFTLFGFLTKPEKEFFMQLLKVNGIGPKMALTAMSGAPMAQIQAWIEAGDAKALSGLPKIGKKTAEQIVLTLQGKLVIIETKGKAGAKTKPETHRQIASALVNLGFKSNLVDQFIESVPPTATLEEGVRQGLQKLSGQL